MVGSYPQNDFTAAQGRKLDGVLDKYDVPHDIKVYPGARHSFLNDRRGNYNAEAAADAWQRTLAYLNTRLEVGWKDDRPIELLARSSGVSSPH